MADSTLLRTGETPPATQNGHGTGALGPSDSSDSGSDVRGGPGLVHDEGIGLDQGTTSDPDLGREPDAGADLGDANLDSDSDRFGTGERGAAGRDATTPVDVTLFDEDGRAVDGEEVAEEMARERAAGNADTDAGPGEEGVGNDDADPDGTREDGNGTIDVERETSRGRADGKPAERGDDVPVFDRAGRADPTPGS